MKQTSTNLVNDNPGKISSAKSFRLFTKHWSTNMVLLLLVLQVAQAQNGYLYVHTKALSEDLNQSFSFSVSGGSTSVPNFTLEDMQSPNIEPTDIGAGHGNGAGELWAVAGATGGGVANGPIYHRLPNSTTWSLVSGQTASAIDGADLGHCVFVNTTGDAYAYNGSSFVKIYNHSTYGMTAVDIANNGSITSGTGVTAIVTSSGHVVVYSGNYSTTNTWTDITPSDNSGGTFTRLDINPATNDIVLVDNNADVTKVNTSGGGKAYYGNATGSTSPWPSTDITVDGNGNIYDIQAISVGDVVFRYNGTGWVSEVQIQEHYVLTGGDAGQVWCTKGYPASQFSWMSNASTIFTRTGDGTATWLDDERVQTSQNDNSILIPVAAGTYTVTEANVSNWNLQRITVYDSTAGSTTNVAAKSAKIVVKAGQVAHVVFTNGLVSPLSVPTGCGSLQILQNFGSGAANTDGSALSGLTDYHYFNVYSTTLFPNDGYYSLSQNSKAWDDSTLKDHTGVANGYFLVVNASYAADQMYKQRVTGLIPGATYSLTFWAANLSYLSPQQPNILAGITDTSTGAILGSVSTGYFPTDTAWHKYTFSFTATITSGDLFLQNNAPGGNGNDLAIDDIGIAQLCTSLPQTLVNFNVVKQATESVLSWATTNNLAFDHFNIQRSTDGITWSGIGQTPAVNDNASQNNYSFVDYAPMNGSNYYRIDAIAANGQYLYSEVKLVQFGSDVQWSLSMYPNPVTSGSTVTIQSNQPLQMIRVFDINGKLVMVKNISNGNSQGSTNYALNTSSLSTGMYLAQVANSDGTINSLKLVKKNQ
jgi:hypothetical protein